MTAVLAALLGAWLGWLAGLVLGSSYFLEAIGAAVAVGLVMAVDGSRQGRLMAWLREPREQSAPLLSGEWGEIAYRMDRALRQADEDLAGESSRLEEFLSAIEASPNGVMLLERSDLIVWCNAAAAEHFGLDRQRDHRQRVTNLVRAPAFVAAFQGLPQAGPVVFPGPGGQRTLSVISRSYGQGMRLMLSQDITERESTDAMRRDFVANVSHEIRSPLTVLAGFVETMAHLPLTEAERQRVLVLMAQQTDRMQALVADLLTLAQLEGNPRPAGDRWNPVQDLMQRARTDAAALSAGRHALQVEGGEGAEIAGDPGELLSAVGNLVNNAVRYTPEGGRISVHWRWQDDGGAVLEVADTGAGIAREHLPRLTERFYRVDGSRSRDTGGTGLGLSIVKHVVQRHGGEIDIQSEPGKGSQFRLVFPPARVRREVAPTPSPAEVQAQG